MPLDWNAERGRLRGLSGRSYWRSLEELSGAPEFQQWVDDEFPGRATLAQLDRRDFVKLMGASMALAGLAGCRVMETEKIVPYVKAPEEIVPGLPLSYATAIDRPGGGIGLLVTSAMGRPIKIEGNELHPSSLGATDVFAQAEILTLYDPDRSKTVIKRGDIGSAGDPASWEECQAALLAAMEAHKKDAGAGLALLIQGSESPTYTRQLAELKKYYPQANVYAYDPVGRTNIDEGAVAAFGQPVRTILHPEKATVIVSIDSDFLTNGPGCVRYAREFMKGRTIRKGVASMNRLYVAECTPTNTGATADHRLALKPSQIEAFAAALAQELGVASGGPTLDASGQAWVKAAAADLASAGTTALVVAGDEQSAAVHTLVHTMNARLGCAGTTVTYRKAEGIRAGSISELSERIGNDEIATLLILGGNPVYDAPSDLSFGEMLGKVRLSVHLGLYADETAAKCKWHVPQTHFLEEWSDTRAHDGTASVIQPLIEPLYTGKSVHDVLGALIGKPVSGYEAVRETWAGPLGSGDAFERTWRRALHDGVIAETEAPSATVTVAADAAQTAVAKLAAPVDGIEIAFRADGAVYDGRYANNGWMQELPKPITKLTWDNAAIVGPVTARENGWKKDQILELRADKDRSLRIPIFVLPGHPEGSLTIHLGYGRKMAGVIGNDQGFDAYSIRTSQNPWWVGGFKIVAPGAGDAAGATISATADSYQLVTAQDHFALHVGEVGNMHERPVVQGGTFAMYREDSKLGASERAFHAGASHAEPGEEGAEKHEVAHVGERISLYSEQKEHAYDGYAWALNIDLTLCTGCNACVTACQAENNIPVVGKQQVSMGREMHWIRIDRYFMGDPYEGIQETLHQPVMCMHCENAPCEPVCPVAATVHSKEGLNQMVYNRCIGTRYCSNNCPYKVRRFNFLNYANHHETDTLGRDVRVLQLLQNPNVTVRGRGVMEKCSYCVQRINAARIEAKKEDRPVRDGEIVTACQQVCPTQAIVFGNKNDDRSKVSQLRAEAHHYAMLTELNTQPRTTYLKKVTNPNPDLKGRSSE